jgi:hypothetical protein
VLVTSFFVRRSSLEREAKEGESPVFEAKKVDF